MFNNTSDYLLLLHAASFFSTQALVSAVPVVVVVVVSMTVENDNRATKPNKSSKTPNRARRPRIAPAGQPKGGSKDSRHPFALYGSGDKAADVAGRKTHNVRPAASTHEVTFLSTAGCSAGL